MIDKKISIGTIVTGITIICTFIFTQGSTSNKIDTLENEQFKVVKRVQATEEDIVNLKIETVLEDRFNRLEEILMDLE